MKYTIDELNTKAKDIRRDIITMLSVSQSGHTAGSMGMADVFTALYFSYLNINPKKPEDKNRDYVVLSNGHICPVLYATLAHKGYFKKEELLTFRKIGSRLQGHPHRESLPGLETSSGPLGSGLSQACGMALGLKMDKRKNKAVCLMSDGEQDEGNTWEGVLFANKYELDNLLVIIDRNNIQIDGFTEDVMPLGSLKVKYEAFGWHVLEINGNRMEEILNALQSMDAVKGKPKAIIANTIPGKGVSFMENKFEWHGKTPNKEETEKALKELA
jgi:transketolase